MLTIVTVLSVVATAAAPIGHRAAEVPELASMALLSVILAGLSVAVRRTGSKASETARGTSRDADRS